MPVHSVARAVYPTPYTDALRAEAACSKEAMMLIPGHDQGRGIDPSVHDVSAEGLRQP